MLPRLAFTSSCLSLPNAGITDVPGLSSRVLKGLKWEGCWDVARKRLFSRGHPTSGFSSALEASEELLADSFPSFFSKR
jgi:hypothetical protein